MAGSLWKFFHLSRRHPKVVTTLFSNQRLLETSTCDFTFCCARDALLTTGSTLSSPTAATAALRTIHGLGAVALAAGIDVVRNGTTMPFGRICAVLIG